VRAVAVTSQLSTSNAYSVAAARAILVAGQHLLIPDSSCADIASNTPALVRNKCPQQIVHTKPHEGSGVCYVHTLQLVLRICAVQLQVS
jgi:hypothetical protein